VISAGEEKKVERVRTEDEWVLFWIEGSGKASHQDTWEGRSEQYRYLGEERSRLREALRWVAPVGLRKSRR